MFGRRSEERVQLFSAFITYCLETFSDSGGSCLLRVCLCLSFLPVFRVGEDLQELAVVCHSLLSRESGFSLAKPCPLR